MSISGGRENSQGLPQCSVLLIAMLAMLTGICTWYRPDGRLSPAEIIALHTRLALEGVLRRG